MAVAAVVAVVVGSMKFANWLTKLTLYTLLVHFVLFNHLPQFQHKGFNFRLVFYPLATLLVPALFYLNKKFKKAGAYPHHIDFCISLVPAMDMLGNTIDFYDKITWWDDLMHVVGMVPWVMFFGFILARMTRYNKRLLFMLTVGFGSTTNIIWELLEYMIFLRTSPTEFATGYNDTMGDMLLSLIGSFTGALLVVIISSKAKPKKGKSAL